MTSEALSSALLLFMIGFPFGVYVVAMRRYEAITPHVKAAKKSKRDDLINGLRTCRN